MINVMQCNVRERVSELSAQCIDIQSYLLMVFTHPTFSSWKLWVFCRELFSESVGRLKI